ncbi:hypothetical protein [Mycobacterium sp. 1274756.6]|uniref:hypothetical protein n=1 Tax=Mycobacterium sp. 1274756.6 TaxID=1834076 RepID=UPI000800AC38|nr:hypothetical protein [Mycobacterium sp. 1274756.6]OBJ70108.1 hypothetical protein A5643_11065 [Mycobacterium sp. 1274756.6]
MSTIHPPESNTTALRNARDGGWSDRYADSEFTPSANPARSRLRLIAGAAALTGSVAAAAAIGVLLFGPGQQPRLDVGPGASVPATQPLPDSAAVVNPPASPVVPGRVAGPIVDLPTAPHQSVPVPSAPAPQAPVALPAPVPPPVQEKPVLPPEATPTDPIVSIGPDGVGVNVPAGPNVSVGADGVGVSTPGGPDVSVRGDGVGVSTPGGPDVSVGADGVHVGVPGALDLTLPPLFP